MANGFQAASIVDVSIGRTRQQQQRGKVGGRGGKEDGGGEKMPVLYFRLVLRNKDNYQLNYVLLLAHFFYPFIPPPHPHHLRAQLGGVSSVLINQYVVSGDETNERFF